MTENQIEQLRLLIVAYNRFIMYVTQSSNYDDNDFTFDNFMHWLAQNYKTL